MNMFGNEYSNRITKLYCGTSTVHFMAVVVLGSLQSACYVLFDVYFIDCKKETVHCYGSFLLSNTIISRRTLSTITRLRN